MKRLATALLLTLCFAVAAPVSAKPGHTDAGVFLGAYQGGVASSPYGGASIRVTPIDDKAGENDPTSRASIWLRTPGAKDRLLGRYDRGLRVYWTPDGRRVVLITNTIHQQAVLVADLDGQGRASPSLDTRLRSQMSRVPPTLDPFNHSIEVERLDANGMTLKVEESGLPPGREEGSFIARDRRFQVTFQPLTVSPLP